MPHFVVEYSRGIADDAGLGQVMDQLVAAGVESGCMQLADIKVRATPYDHYRLAQPGQTFIHVTVSLLEGRSDAVKAGLAVIVRDKLDALLPEVTSISIDIRDMNPVAYKKRLLA